MFGQTLLQYVYKKINILFVGEQLHTLFLKDIDNTLDKKIKLIPLLPINRFNR